MIVKIVSDTLAFNIETGRRVVNLKVKNPEIALQKMNLLIEIFKTWNWTVIDDRDLTDPEPEVQESYWR